MGNDARKYILIPEYAPLWAMKKCWGPEHGPLTAPTLTPVDIIGELLNQVGQEKVSIYEVIREGTGFSKPVRLTKVNYKLPYEKIVGIKEEPMVQPISVEPVKEPKLAEFIPQEDPNPPVVESDPLDDLAETAKDTLGEDAVVIDETNEIPAEEPVDNAAEVAATDELTTVDEIETDDAAEETPTETVVTDPYAGLSKSQRKKLRREEAARRAAEEALESTNTNG